MMITRLINLFTPDRHNETCAVLDIGTSKITCLIARRNSDGTVVMTGRGHRRSKGVRNGMIIDIRAAASSIRATVHAAEDMAGHRISTLSVNLTTTEPTCVVRHASTDVSAHEIGNDDIERLHMATALQSRQVGETILHAITQCFSIDNSAPIRDPRGMYGQSLAAEILHITVKSGLVRSLVRCINTCDLTVESVSLSPYATALACLEDDERHLGAACIDLGGGTTGLAFLIGDRLVHIDSFPIGGDHITLDIARGLGVSIATAERLKTLHGSVIPGWDGDQEDIETSLLGGEHRAISRPVLNGIIRPRMEEILELVRDRIETSGYAGVVGERVVLTGGGSLLQGLREAAETILERRVRLGVPHSVAKMPETATIPETAPGMKTALGPETALGPIFSTSVGLINLRLTEHRQYAGQPHFVHRLGDKLLSRIGLRPRGGI